MMASSSGAGPKIVADEASQPRLARSSGLKSMTGYAQTRIVENGWSLRVAVRSVNHRFLDLHLRVPEESGFSRHIAGRATAPGFLSRLRNYRA